jgi:acetate kinase
MDTILIVNAGSSSIKFQVFGVDTARKLTRRIKGQLDRIGTRPHLGEAAGGQSHCGSHL